jgi:hypothetical protein
MNAADIYTRAREAGDNEELWLWVAAALDVLEAKAFYSKDLHEEGVKALARVTHERDVWQSKAKYYGSEMGRLREAFEKYLRVTRPLLDDTKAWAEAHAALKPNTGELLDYVEFTDGTTLIGEEATAFFKSNTGETP